MVVGGLTGFCATGSNGGGRGGSGNSGGNGGNCGEDDEMLHIGCREKFLGVHNNSIPVFFFLHILEDMNLPLEI
ncbi:hypothetical protein RchiOBHm_Chr1g0333601 [Rosa chinensis]|uniref:Uncharacterized protein n=1 Tax=Rosa chinensis TaxID=74649 RepID=A0A2P6SC32_ROSCH|nr:hypothetical protein RchiOBHm_Chr1g0333601 [Rosa chinensis]